MDIHLALHSLVSLIAMVVISLYYEVVEVLHDVFELGFSNEDCFYLSIS